MNIESKAVLLIAYNRPKNTRRLIKALRKANVSKIFVSCDGAKGGSDARNVEKVRQYALKLINWNCDVQFNFEKSNLGCKSHVIKAIDWVFEFEEEAIVLEDDCLPDPSFFEFCNVMLNRYSANERIFMISGRNELGSWKDAEGSYFYTLGGIWGWATWKRAWQYNAQYSELWSKLDNQIEFHKSKKRFPEYVRNIESGCIRVNSGEIDTWDYQWAFVRICKNGFTITPSKNLIKNIGFGINATHTINQTSNEPKRFRMNPPYRTPSKIELDKEYINTISSKNAENNFNIFHKKIIRILRYTQLFLRSMKLGFYRLKSR